MPNPVRALAGAVVMIGLASCAAMEAKEKADDPSLQGVETSLARFPGAKQEFLNYYEDHGAEGDYSCGVVDIGNILRVSKLSETPTQVRLAIHYEFASEDMSGGQSEYCHFGFNTRIVTYNKSGGGVTLASMTGDYASAQRAAPVDRHVPAIVVARNARRGNRADRA